jgi:hypothetical protein
MRINCIRRHQDFELAVDDHVQVFARIPLPEKDIARVQIDDVHLGHQAIQFLRRKVGEEWNVGKQVYRHILVLT